MKKCRSVLVAGLLAASAAIVGQGPGGPGGPGGRGGPGGERAPQVRVVFLALDADKDGTLSAREIAKASAVLTALDKDGDGQLTSLEFLPVQAAPQAPAESYALLARLMEYDANKDGVLTKDELPERMQPMMLRADLNHDGKLTSEEIRLSASNAIPGGRVQAGGEVTRMDPVLNALDADHDGIISAAEIANAPVALLLLDVDHDGQLVASETMMRQQPGGRGGRPGQMNLPLPTVDQPGTPPAPPSGHSDSQPADPNTLPHEAVSHP